MIYLFLTKKLVANGPFFFLKKEMSYEILTSSSKHLQLKGIPRDALYDFLFSCCIDRQITRQGEMNESTRERKRERNGRCKTSNNDNSPIVLAARVRFVVTSATMKKLQESLALLPFSLTLKYPEQRKRFALHFRYVKRGFN